MTHCHCQGHQRQPKGQYQVINHLGWLLECSEYLVINLVFQTFGFFLSIPVPSFNSNFIILHLEKIYAKFQNFWNFVLLRNLLQQYVGLALACSATKIVGMAQLAYLIVGKSKIYKLMLSRLGVWKTLGQESLLQDTGWVSFSSRKLQACSQGLSTGWMRPR